LAKFRETSYLWLSSESQTHVLISNMVGCRGHFGVLFFLHFLLKGTFLPGSKELGSIEPAKKLDQFCDRAGPAGLMAGPQARAVVSVEVFVEQQVILPLRIGLEFLRASVNRPPSSLIPQEDPDQPIGKVPSYFEQIVLRESVFMVAAIEVLDRKGREMLDPKNRAVAIGHRIFDYEESRRYEHSIENHCLLPQAERLDSRGLLSQHFSCRGSSACRQAERWREAGYRASDSHAHGGILVEDATYECNRTCGLRCRPAERLQS
jgi:hypothetical protein